MDADQAVALQLHNQVRAEVSVAPLAWNANLAAWAQQYAAELASLDRGMQHCKQLRDIKQGENLATCSGPWANPLLESSKSGMLRRKGVIQAQGCEKWGHYTQMIWSTTTLVGMAHAVAASRATYVVARYSLPGNRLGDSPTANASNGGGAQQMPAQTQMPAQAQIPTQVQNQQPGQLTTQKKAKQKQKPPRTKYLWPENVDPERENKYMRGPQAYNSYPRPPFGPYEPHGPYSPYEPFPPGMRPSRRMQPAVGCAVM